MKYAITTGRVIWSIHKLYKRALKKQEQLKKEFPKYPFHVLELTPKGERPGWEKGDSPALNYFNSVNTQSKKS